MKKIKITLIIFLAIVAFGAKAQTSTITGVVTSATDNSPLPGVNVVVKGTTNGTITDNNGKYQISANQTDILVFSFIGFLSEEVAITSQQNVDVILVEDIEQLAEVVIVGYGAQRKSDLTGAVAVVDVKEMKKQAEGNMASMLQGRVAGVTVTSDGNPGADPNIRIRGIGTFNNATPLYVIDGVIIDGIRDFSPSDIESMQILKDASAAALYGSRAANGVVIITTKKGKKNQPLNVSYSGYLGIDKINQRMPVLTSQNYQTMYNMSLTNQGMPIRPANDPASDAYISNVDTDWQAEGFETGIRHNHNVAMTGGGETGTYAIILDYLDSKGTLVGFGPDYKRYSARANTTFEKKFFSGGASLVYTHTNQNSLNVTSHSSFSGGSSTMVLTLTSLIPTMKVYDPEQPNGYGTYDVTTQGEDYSLNIIGVNKSLSNIVNVDRVLGNGYGIIKFGDIFDFGKSSLDYKINVSYDKTHCHDYLWIPAFSFSNFYTNNTAVLTEGWREYTNGIVENTLNFKTQISKLKVDALAGQTFQAYSYYNIEGEGQGFSEPYYPKLTNATNSVARSYQEHAFMLSYLGRANMEYDDKYLMTANIRYDATSRVSANYRSGIFPSFSLGWKMHNEPFFAALANYVSELKLRGGWGKLGNQAIGPYEYLAVLNRNQVYSFNNVMVQGSSEDDIFPQKLLWENKTTTNIGADMSFLNRKLDFTIEYYDAFTDGILVDVEIPLTVGSVDRNLRANAAQLSNKGLEFALGFKEREKNFKYNISVNGTTIKNKVISLGQDGQPRYGTASRTIEGQEIGRHYGYKYLGIFKTDDEVAESPFQSASTRAGDIKYADLNNDGVINDSDKTDLGSALPKFTYGINLGCEYKNFDLTVFMSGAAGYLVADYNYRVLMHSGGGLNWHQDILNAWTPDNTNTDIPRVVYQDPNANGRDSDRPGWLQKGDYLRVSNITLGYTFPTSVLKNTFKSARLYASVQNIYTLTKYKGFNPAFANTDVWAPGFNGGSYPLPATFLFGMNFDF